MRLPPHLEITWTCPCCSQQFYRLPLAYAFSEPDAWREILPEHRRWRGVLGTDSCTIDRDRHFVRGRIVLPVSSGGEFIWGVWAEVSKAGFKRFGELWDIVAREREPPILGTLANAIMIYPQTLGLACRIHLKNDRMRPIFRIERHDHPLGIEQSDGITLDRVKAIASKVYEHRK